MSKEETYYLEDLVEVAIEEYETAMKEGYVDCHEDTIHEIADGCVPIYTYEILQYAAQCAGQHWLALEPSELCPDGDAIKQITCNIYEHLCEKLHEHIAEKEKEDE